MWTTPARLAGTALAGAALILAAPAFPAAAADPSATGSDVSHPQCSKPVPAAAAFTVVGVDGGVASTPNPCLAEQLAWAATSSGADPAQPPVQLYLNTANPGELRGHVRTWPASGHTPYGDCDGANDTACSWQYGWERAEAGVDGFFPPAATAAGLRTDPAAYTWWLDVETLNTWQGGSDAAISRNRATLEGMAAYLLQRGARVGLYSTPEQWEEIAGSVGWDSNLHSLPSWLAGATDPDEARAACADDPLVAGGTVVLAQYVTEGIDGDVGCD